MMGWDINLNYWRAYLTQRWRAWATGKKNVAGPYKANWRTYYIGHGLKIVRFQKKNGNNWFLTVKVYKNGKLVQNKDYANWFFTIRQFKPIIIKNFA